MFRLSGYLTGCSMLQPLGLRYNGNHLALAGNIGMDTYEKNIREFNKQLTYRGLHLERLERLRGARPDAVIICGMGGSGLAGEIIAGAAHELGIKVPITLWKDYELPQLAARPKNPLLIFVSFSGNTEENVSSLERSFKEYPRAPKAAIATGGKLLDIASRRNIAAVSFDSGVLVPRQGTGRMFYAIAELLSRTNVIRKRPPEFVRLNPIAWRKLAYPIARKLAKKLIVIYSQTTDQYLGYLWKIRFNETTKTVAFQNIIPEMNHNELVGFVKHHIPTVALLLIPQKLGSRMVKRFRVTETLLKEHRVPVIHIPLRGKTQLERTWNMVMLADWTSYLLAGIRGANPSETHIIDKLKAAMLQ